ncbi:hypothetical protein X805_13370 [Sphaerotilus natans subsp. natans DSM 6575]|uniref:Uncharacterized protein n=1 Tax=Sphaerotilus natans subsp. natans DSM 6575 TaxID=1286631 RepID=A0A059KNL5_9BURK|nr:hypothetical protein X805_13370 [Sphaerotilus natans subsp. natans DSM 6575]
MPAALKLTLRKDGATQDFHDAVICTHRSAHLEHRPGIPP